MTLSAFCPNPPNAMASNRLQEPATPYTTSPTPTPAMPWSQSQLNQVTPLQQPAGALRPLSPAPRSLRTALGGRFWPDSDYPDASIKAPLKLTYQPLDRAAYPVFELTQKETLPEFPSESTPGVTEVDLARLLTPGSLYLAFSETDVHVGEVMPGNALRKLTTTACPWAGTSVTQTDGADQAGFYLVPRDLPAQARQALVDAATHLLGHSSQSSTGVVTTVLKNAGFELTQITPTPAVAQKTLDTCQTPKQLFQAILAQGLSVQGQPLPARLVNTSGNTLQHFKQALDHASCKARSQHLQSLLETPAAKVQRHQAAQAIRANTPPPATPDLPTLETEDPLHPIPVAAARTSPLGAGLRHLVSPHVLFNVPLAPQATAQHLPEQLAPFSQKNPDLLTRLKRDVLFPPSTAEKVSQLMAESFDPPTPLTGAEFLSLLANQASPKADQPPRFNCVINDTALVLGQVKAQCPPIDDILSKHVLLANYDPVRFAGELYAQNDTLFVTRNSGTYRPTETQLNAAVALLRQQFPSIQVEADCSDPA